MSKTNQIVSWSIAIFLLGIMVLTLKDIKQDNSAFKEDVLKYDSLLQEYRKCSELNDRYRENNPDFDLWEEVRIIKEDRDVNRGSE